MRDFCFGVVGFCSHFTILTFARQQFLACLVFITVLAIALMIGTQVKETPAMKSKIHPMPTPAQSADDAPGQDASRVDIVSAADQSSAIAVPDLFEEDRIRQ